MVAAVSVPLDLDQLQSFCAIADCGSFTEAARRVNKTQSAVSMQIKRLEERLGHALLSRDGRTVALTQHGEALYARARKMLKINAEIMDEFLDEDLAGAIRFGVPDDYAVRLLPVILSSKLLPCRECTLTNVSWPPKPSVAVPAARSTITPCVAP